MEQCPECKGYLVCYDHVRERKYCISATCDYEEYYCRFRYNIENDVLPKLVEGAKKGKCRTPKGWRECDTCELRA